MSKLDLTLEEVRRLVGEGEIVGDAGFRCESVASLEAAGPQQLSFLKSESYEERARESGAGALLVPERLEAVAAHQLIVEEPFKAFAKVLHYVAQRKRAQRQGIDPGAFVSETAVIGEEVSIGAGAVVSDGAVIGDRVVIYPTAYVGARSVIGDDAVLFPNVTVMEDVTVGDRVSIHGGTVIGADGYGYIRQESRHVKVPQVGSVAIGDDVEIGALCTIDRATVDATVIGRGTKIGDLVHVAHNCKIGEDVLLLPTVSISGSCEVGDHVVFAGRSGCADNLKIGEGAVLGGTAVAFKDVEAGAMMWGNPARDKTREMRIQAGLSKLPEMQRDLRELRKTLRTRKTE